MKTRHLAIAILVVVLWAVLSPLTQAAAQALVIEPQVDYVFGGEAHFQARVAASQPVQSAQIYLSPGGDAPIITDLVSVTADGQLNYTCDLSRQTVRPFGPVRYWFSLTLADGAVVTSETFSFDYIDNRFEWKQLEAEPFRVYWYEGDEAFGQSLLQVARQGWERAQSLVPFAAPLQMDIYVYATATALQSALNLTGLTWVAGHADPELGVVVVSLPAGPGQQLEAQRQIPHELMHILLYQAAGAGSVNVPVWLNEGLASLAQPNPDPNYYTILQDAAERNAWLPLSTLCAAFPNDTSGAYLAYAQADSFTRYLHAQYGSAGLQNLLLGYARGLDCERGPEVTLGKPLSQLERDWQQHTFGRISVSGVIASLLPWLALLLAVLAMPVVLILAAPRKSRRLNAQT